jgi:sugar lactone lactonase YvrE
VRARGSPSLLSGGTGASSTFTPALTAQPNDFTVAINFQVPNLNRNDGVDHVPAGFVHPIAIDAAGNVWILNPGQNSVVKLSNSGSVLCPAAGYTGGGLNNPRSIALDNSGNAWITDVPSTVNPNSGQLAISVTELSSTGAALSPPAGFVPDNALLGAAIAIDASGNAWFPYGNGVADLSSSGSFITAVANPPGAGSPIGGIAIDAAGNLWGGVPFGGFFNEFSMSGALVNPPTVGQYSCGAPVLGEQEPDGVAIDAAGDVWITSGQGFTKESKSPIPPCSGQGGGIVLLPEGEGGDIAIDGDGNAWVVIGALSEFSNSGVPLSPANGYLPADLFALEVSVVFQAPNIALDGSGNVWAVSEIYQTNNFLNYFIYEFIGASAPVVTPIAAGVKNNTIASRP